MERKSFIKACGFACIGGTLLSTVLQSCSNANYYAKSSQSGKSIVIKRSEFINSDNGQNTPRKYVLARTDKFNYPICVYKTGDELYSALLMECTHKSCELQPHGDYLICPCHGSEFSNKGLVQNPPAEENLKTFIVKTDNENIYIQL